MSTAATVAEFVAVFVAGMVTATGLMLWQARRALRKLGRRAAARP